MPIPVDKIKVKKHSFEERITEKSRNIIPTGYGALKFPDGNLDDFFHSKYIIYKYTNYQTTVNIEKNSTVKQVIKYKDIFLSELNRLSHYYADIDKKRANNFLSKSLNFLLDLNPDQFTLELTTDKSIFYTFKKDDFTFFISHFLDVLDEDDDEIAYALFKNNTKEPSYAGDFETFQSEFRNNLLLMHQ